MGMKFRRRDIPGADVGPVAEFLYEPDGAVIRAGLVTAVAAGVHGHLLDRRIAVSYAQSTDRIASPPDSTHPARCSVTAPSATLVGVGK